MAERVCVYRCHLSTVKSLSLAVENIVVTAEERIKIRPVLLWLLSWARLYLIQIVCLTTFINVILCSSMTEWNV